MGYPLSRSIPFTFQWFPLASSQTSIVLACHLRFQGVLKWPTRTRESMQETGDRNERHLKKWVWCAAISNWPKQPPNQQVLGEQAPTFGLPRDLALTFLIFTRSLVHKCISSAVFTRASVRTFVRILLLTSAHVCLVSSSRIWSKVGTTERAHLFPLSFFVFFWGLGWFQTLP